MRIEHISKLLSPDADGIYISETRRAISYATEGHSDCFQVEDLSFWFRHRNDCIASMIANHSFSGALLDIGAGNGFIAQRLVREGHEVVLLEPGMVGARNARLQRGLKNVVCSTIDDAQFVPGSFGAIGLFDVIEHIDDDIGFLDRISPLLSPDGRIYLTVPCHNWLWSQADLDAGHFRRHTCASLERLLDKQFTIDYLSYFFRPLIIPQLLFRALPHRLGLFQKETILSTEAEHGSGNGLSVRIVNQLLRGEARSIARGERLSYGASCLVAATVR